jgi:hypothetical protein
MNRRDFLTAWFAALLLALFPWLRTERGVDVALRSADALVDCAYEIRVVSHCYLVCESPGWNAKVTL